MRITQSKKAEWNEVAEKDGRIREWSHKMFANFGRVMNLGGIVWKDVLADVKNEEEARAAWQAQVPLYQQLMVDKVHDLFNELQLDMAHRCLALVALVSQYGMLIKEWEKQSESGH